MSLLWPRATAWFILYKKHFVLSWALCSANSALTNIITFVQIGFFGYLKWFRFCLIRVIFDSNNKEWVVHSIYQFFNLQAEKGQENKSDGRSSKFEVWNAHPKKSTLLCKSRENGSSFHTSNFDDLPFCCQLTSRPLLNQFEVRVWEAVCLLR